MSGLFRRMRQTTGESSPPSFTTALNRLGSKFESLQPPQIISCYTHTCWVKETATFIATKIRERITVVDGEGNEISSGKYAVVGLSGGDSVRPVYALLNAMMKDDNRTDWSRVIFFLVDERYVSQDEGGENSNTRLIKDVLLKDTQIPDENFLYPVIGEDLQRCMNVYEHKLAEIFHISRPTLVCLGMGPDGHIASWFPPLSGDEAFAAYDPLKFVCYVRQDRFVVPDRITVSMHLLLSARCKLISFWGDAKIARYKAVVGDVSSATLRQQPLLQVLRSGDVALCTYPPLERDEVTELHALWEEQNAHLNIVILGASGDLAIKKTFPALFGLFCSGNLPRSIHITGYARSKITIQELFTRLHPKLQAMSRYFESCDGTETLARFQSCVNYVQCESYDSVESAKSLNEELMRHEQSYLTRNRLFYLALPPKAFDVAVKCLRAHCWSPDGQGWNRVVVEKPFGKDSQSSQQLAITLAQSIDENQTYRIDHYLGKEMVLNLFVLRFANVFLVPMWNRHFVKCIRITFKELAGVDGRGSYFDEYGIIRDVTQNHLLQILSLVAMEAPVTLVDEDIRDEKVKVLRSIEPATMDCTVLGQYIASDSMPGYTDDATVPQGSKTPTFCTTVLFVNNERWHKVPFILKAGKGLDSTTAEVRLQLHNLCGTLFGSEVPPNEFVFRIQPNDAIYMKFVGKQPGLTPALAEAELDLTVMQRFNVSRLNDAYERLLLDVIKGDKKNFVRTDELREAWRIFTPLLHEIESKNIIPEPYLAGSAGPESSYQLIRSYGYKKPEGYKWKADAI